MRTKEDILMLRGRTEGTLDYGVLEVLCDIRDQIAEHNNMMQAVINGKKAINVGGVVYNQV